MTRHVKELRNYNTPKLDRGSLSRRVVHAERLQLSPVVAAVFVRPTRVVIRRRSSALDEPSSIDAYWFVMSCGRCNVSCALVHIRTLRSFVFFSRETETGFSNTMHANR